MGTKVKEVPSTDTSPVPRMYPEFPNFNCRICPPPPRPPHPSLPRPAPCRTTTAPASRDRGTARKGESEGGRRTGGWRERERVRGRREGDLDEGEEAGDDEACRHQVLLLLPAQLRVERPCHTHTHTQDRPKVSVFRRRSVRERMLLPSLRPRTARAPARSDKETVRLLVRVLKAARLDASSALLRPGFCSLFRNRIRLLAA